MTDRTARTRGLRTLRRAGRPDVAPSRRHLSLALTTLVCVAIAPAQEPTTNAAGDAAHLRRAQELVFRAALETVSPSIVRIDTIGGALPVEQIESPDGEPVAVPLFRQADGPTTGVICSADGYILTSSFNFQRDPVVITVVLADGRRFVARLIARDRPAGLTLIKIDATNSPMPRWLERAELRPGQWALAAGFGHDSPTPALSVGVLSATDRLEGRAVQTDAKTSPANYGGPLFDIEGRVIGVCVPQAGDDAEGLSGVEWYDSGTGFAIHADYIRDRLPRLQRGEDLERGLLGLRFDAADPIAGSPETAPAKGLRITGVAPGPAASAGLQPGDVLTQVNGHPMTRFLAFRRELARHAAGDTITLTYRRADADATVSLRLARLEQLQAAAATQPASQPATMPAPTQPAGAEP